MAKDNSPIEFTTACYIGDRLVSHYPHSNKVEADIVMRNYQSRPAWHLYTKIVQRDAAGQVIREWAR